MLILTRTKGKSLIIGDNIKITILDVNGPQVRIGIEAPKELPVHREEIYNRIKNSEKEIEEQGQGEELNGNI